MSQETNFPLMKAVDFRTNFVGYVTRSGFILLYDNVSLKAKICPNHGFPLKAETTYMKHNNLMSIEKEFCEKCNQE